MCSSRSILAMEPDWKNLSSCNSQASKRFMIETNEAASWSLVITFRCLMTGSVSKVGMLMRQNVVRKQQQQQSIKMKKPKVLVIRKSVVESMTNMHMLMTKTMINMATKKKTNQSKFNLRKVPKILSWAMICLLTTLPSVSRKAMTLMQHSLVVCSVWSSR